MIHVLHVNTFYYPNVRGGAETMAQLQAELLQERGIRASVLCIGDQKGLHCETINDVTVWRAGIRNIYWHYNGHAHSAIKRKIWHAMDVYNPFVIPLVQHVLRKSRPDIVICHNLMGWSSALWSAVRSERVPLVQILHDQYLLCVRATMRRNEQNCTRRCPACRAMRLPHRRLSGKLDGVVGVSRFVLDRFRQFGYFEDVPVQRVIYNAPASTAFPSAATRSVRQDRPAVRFGFIGRLRKGKGIEYLLRVFSRVQSPDVELIVAGDTDGPCASDLARKYGGLSNVTFLGHVKPELFYRQVDVVVVPSLWHDTLPTTVMEAMLYGLPVIGSRRGGIPEMLTDGENGLIFDPAEPSQLQACMEKIAANSNMRREMGRVSAERAPRFADHKRFRREYADLYREILNQQRCAEGSMKA